MMSDAPKFSIVIATYNSASTLARAIDSVRAQSFPSECYELVVIDDGSSDNTPTLLRAYASHLPKQQFQYLRHTNNLGTGAARNSGCTLARGHYVLYLDADDALLKNALNSFAKGLKEANRLGLSTPLIVSGHETIFENGKTRIIHAPKFSAQAIINFKRHVNSDKRIAVCGAYIVPRIFYTQYHFPAQFPTAEDFIYCGWALATLQHWSIPQITVQIYKRPSSRRSSILLDKTLIDSILHTLFDPKILPKRFHAFRDECCAALYLSGFRRCRRMGQYRKALGYWKQALHAHAISALRVKRLLALLGVIARYK